MQITQAIRTPQGVSVFGSAQLRAAPDVAVLQFSVTRYAASPGRAFQETRSAARDVREFLSRSDVRDVQASRITLLQKWDHSGRSRTPDGYYAKSSFSVVLRELDQLEPVLCGVVDAGAHEVNDVSFQSGDLKRHRNRARELATNAALQKAQLYASSLGCVAGEPLHIEDINPDRLRRTEGHYPSEPQIDEEEPVTAFDPGSITVVAAVMVVFRLITEPSA